MKKIFCYLMVLFISLWVFNGCRKMDSKYSQFIVTGGIIYTGKANSPKAYAGRNRVQITWQSGADPNITKARIFWNSYADSVEVNVPLDADSIVVIIDNLLEKTYTFFIRNYDAKGIPSVPVEISGGSYGERYQSRLLNQVVNSSFIDVPGQFSIQWGSADITSGAIATEVKYTDFTGVIRFKKFGITDSESKILDYMPGTTFQYRTLYIPKALSIDTFYTSFVENKYFKMKKSDWIVNAYSSQSNNTTYAAKNFIDGNNATGWGTNTTTARYPYFYTIDMGTNRGIAAFELFRLLNNTQGCDTFKMLVSLDNITWTDLGVFNFNRMTDDGQIFEIPSHPTARYFKFTGLTGPLTYEVLGEINAYEL